MPRYKGTRYVTMRKVMQDQTNEVEQQFIGLLEAREKEKYLNAQAISWFDINELPQQGELFKTAAQILFPGDSQGLEKIGTLNAKASLTGIYKLFLRIPSPDFVLRRVAQVWRSYQDTGEALTENRGIHQIDFIIKNYPDLPVDFRQYLNGYIRGVLELTGIKNSKIIHDESHSEAWCWHISW